MSLPYFPMFPSDFEAKTSHLTLAEDGAYNRLLRICWMTPGCSIPADEAWIMRRVRAFDEAEKEAVRTVLDEFFTVEKGRYSNAKLTRIFNEANEAHEKRKNAGAKGGKAKALKTNDPAPSNAIAKPKQPEPEPEPIKSIDQSAPDPCFDEFWKEWPLGRVGKQKAKAAFNRLSQQNQKIATERVKEWARGWRTKYPQASDIHPTSYLNGKRWEDEFNTSTPDQSAKVDRWRKLAGG